jgi:hypothetical protein
MNPIEYMTIEDAKKFVAQLNKLGLPPSIFIVPFGATTADGYIPLADFDGPTNWPVQVELAFPGVVNFRNAALLKKECGAFTFNSLKALALDIAPFSDLTSIALNLPGVTAALDAAIAAALK